MADNVLETIQKLVQDVIAPDVRELKARVDGLDKRIDGLDKRIDGLDKHMQERFDLSDQRMHSFQQQILAAFGELKASMEASTLREVATLRERVAVLEVQQRQSQRAA